jgi:hypothetical protein
MGVPFPALFAQASLFVVKPYYEEQTKIKLLLASIIRRAAFDIALYRDDPKLVNRKVAWEAYRWMFREPQMPPDPIDQFTSFLNICDVLDQDPEWIRRNTLELRREDVKKFDRIER